MTDTAYDTYDDWSAGYEFGDDPDAVTPAAVTPPVTRAVTPPVTASGTRDVTWDGDGPVTPQDAGPDGPLGIGQWNEAPDLPGPDRDGGLAGPVTWLAALAKASPLLGGSALAAELADPRPGTWARHWRHVTRHENMPAGTWAAAGFTAGHLAVTGPLKLAGKAMTATGSALAWTGKRADLASDHFMSAVIFIVLAAAIIAVIVIAAGQVTSYLP